jgi:hypothetical protein
MTMNARDYQAMQQQAACNQERYAYGLSGSRAETTDDAIRILRAKAECLREQIASVPEWERELLRIDATLKAWGDK